MYADIEDGVYYEYVLTAGDVDKFVRVVITATNANGTASTTSAALGPILAE